MSVQGLQSFIVLSFGWKYLHLCLVCLNQTLVLLSLSNSSIQPKRYFGGQFCEHAIKQEKELIKKSKWNTFTWDLQCRDSLHTSTWAFLLSLIEGQGRHFDGVTNDIRNYETLENLQNKRNTEFSEYLISELQEKQEKKMR